MSAPKLNVPPAGGDAQSSTPNRVASALQSSVKTLTSHSSNFLGHSFPPQKRQQWKQSLTKFSTERPYLASFLLSQLAISLGPVLLVTVIAFTFALLTGIFLGALGAFLFVSGVMGLASLVLLPMLFFTSGAAVLIWFWGSVAISLIKWFRPKDGAGGREDDKAGLVKAGSVTNGNPLGRINQGAAPNKPPRSLGGAENGPSQASRPQSSQYSPSNIPEQQQPPNSTPTLTPNQPPSSPDSGIPPRTPVSRSPSPDAGTNGSGSGEEQSEGQNLQDQLRQPVLSRTPSSSPTPPTNGAAAGEQQAEEGPNSLQPRQPVSRPASLDSALNGGSPVQGHENGEDI